MKTMRLSLVDPENVDLGFRLVSKDAYQPAICTIDGLRFHDTEPLLQMGIDWINKGSYTNGQRKKLVARTLVRILKREVRYRLHKLNTKEQNV